jgi:hypothetical protein
MHGKEEKKIYRWQVSVSVLILFKAGAFTIIPFSREVKRLNIKAKNTNINLKNDTKYNEQRIFPSRIYD